MLTLYFLFGLMLIIALILLSIPFIKNHRDYITFSTIALTLCLAAFGIYRTSTNVPALSAWLAEGETHYNLLLQIKQLGGVGEIINQIKLRLQENPKDAKGWIILGKLYLSQKNYVEAKDALGHALQLQPFNQEVQKILVGLNRQVN